MILKNFVLAGQNVKLLKFNLMVNCKKKKQWRDDWWFMAIYRSTTLNICLYQFTAIKMKQNFDCVLVFFVL